MKAPRVVATLPDKTRIVGTYTGAGSVQVEVDGTGPTVSLTASSTQVKQAGLLTLSANASDEVGVVRVEFYVNGALLTTDATAPYVACWNTRRPQDGANTISAVAYDARGNTRVAEITAYR